MNKEKGRNKMKRYLVLILMVLLVLPLCACAVRPSKKTMESIAAKMVPESAKCVSSKDVGNDICFSFKSDQRDLIFEVYAIKNDGYPGYFPREEYAKAVRDYYDDAIMKELAPCRCFMRKNSTNEATAYELKSTSEDELREIAKVIANCNKIVADQFEYTPGADLTSPKLMYIRMLVLNESATGDGMTTYVLNGLDDEDVILRKIRVTT